MEKRRLPLHSRHVALGAKMSGFASWEMPVYYKGIPQEHMAVREQAGLFDLSHMGEIEVGGPGGFGLVQRLTSNDISTVEVGQAQYSLLLSPDGGVLDDIIVYRKDDGYLLVVNAINTEKDLAWLREHATQDAHVRDVSCGTGLLAIQGPRSEEILQGLTRLELSRLQFYWFARSTVAGVLSLVSRTGYTGEDGFELFFPAEYSEALWDALLEAGQSQGLVPIGLGARDSLRIEMGYPLYGHELDENTTPYEAGLGRFVKLGKGEFIGGEILAVLKEKPRRKCLIGLVLTERGVPREDCQVQQDRASVGRVTSGTFSPILGAGIALAYVERDGVSPGERFEVTIRGRSHGAIARNFPFVMTSRARKRAGAIRGVHKQG